MTLSILLLFLAWLPDGFERWLNYPGWEAWRFFNLLVFIAAGFYLHARFGRPIREALRSRSEGIRRELERARDERDQALAQLAEVEARFANLDGEIAKVKERTAMEAAGERERVRVATEEEISKLRDQAKREIESAGKAARHELRRFAADESVRLAEEILVREIKPDDDVRLTSQSVQELGGTRA